MVTRAHGLGGEVKVRLDWEGSQTLGEVAWVTVELEGRRQRVAVQRSRSAGRGLLVKFEGIDDRDEAERLRGAGIYVERKDLAPLAAGEFYLADLVGARVVAPDGPVGVVEAIELHPTVDALVVRTEQGERLEQPLLDVFVADVDVDAGIVTLHSREGLV